MRIRNKDTGKVYNVVGGTVLEAGYAKTKSITGSFLTVENIDDPEDQQYVLWSYLGENRYEVVEESQAV